MRLVIVESPTKAKTIGKFLGKEYRVDSSYGHVRDLPKSKLGIDLEADFAPQYVIPTKAKTVVARLKKEIVKSDGVILATDEDREGEAIAWHLAQVLGIYGDAGGKQGKKPDIPAERIVFHEITKSAIEDALKHPRAIDMKLVDAQQGRRVLDRLVGYKLSPFLWKKVARGLSAGRVQSVAVRLIADRENEIRGFQRQEYWTVAVSFETGAKEVFSVELHTKNGETLGQFALRTASEAEAVADDLRVSSAAVEKLVKREARRNPSPPFTTSTLQQEAAKRLGFTAKKTMFIAQRLYENGRITYMRTDSVNLSREAVAAVAVWLRANFGEAYALQASRRFETRSKLAQEAHEAIRPTDVAATADTIAFEEIAEQKLYDLIWRRFVASQMPEARVATASVTVRAASEKTGTTYGLKANGQRVTFDGFLKVWPLKLMELELPELREGEALAVCEVTTDQHFTEPPPRYSEATLVKTLEEYGIGRPSTYAPIISVIQVRNYVTKDKGRFFPTEMGELVNKVLTEHFPEIVDVEFTARMEGELDGIAEGKARWQKVIGDFYVPFAKRLAEKYEEVSKKELTTEATNEVCEKCGKPMVIRMGRFGKFMACSGFPECRNTKKIAGEGGKAAPEPTGIKCSKCGEGELVTRRVSKGRARGKMFWGCNRYPKCDHATWENPKGEGDGNDKKPEAGDKEKDDVPEEGLGGSETV